VTPVRIEPAGNRDLDSLTALLDAGHLPTDGLGEHLLQTTLVARDAAEIIGCVALEPYGKTALLRSLAVIPSRRRHGVGQQLTRAALDLARQQRVVALYLLTTTAAEFFAHHFGFRPIVRAEVPVVVQQSVEFMSACPETAQAMVREVER
jgi:N-acetylglutamate synthase-like GNAT family acetyltransferase